MNKRIISLVISFVLVFSMVTTAMPVQAKAGKTTTLTMSADKTMAKPGDVVNYTITLGAVEDLLGIKFKLIIPDGLTFVSSHVPVDVQPVLGATSAEFNENTKVFLADPEYTGTEELLLMSFSCSVNEGASGSQTVQIYIDDPDNYYDSDGDNIEVNITNHTVNIGIPLPGGNYGDSEKPKKPIIESIVGNIAILVSVAGYEYSADGANWQESNVFEIPMNELVYFYQRKVDNGSGLPQTMSEPVKGISVSAPTVLVGNSTIYIKPVEGFEYGVEGLLWQNDNVFADGIISGEGYTVYQRYAGADDVFAVYDEEGTDVVVNGNSPIKRPNETHLSALRVYLVEKEARNNVSADFNGDFEINVKDIVHLKKILSEDGNLGVEGPEDSDFGGIF